ncbi:MAG: hypothetical protein L0I76_14640 [Pseudonocardia sp.]|nr:hypothetical protein [Pseudonocardia sp.]MDN5930814.1 hypothetical protein [Pseudonocardia sp.]
MNVLLVGRTPAVIAEVLEQVDAPATTFYTGNSLEDVVAVLERTQVDHVILGGGLDLDTRLQIVRSVFESSTSTTVHMNSPSGPDSYLPFVRAVLRGFGR